MTSRLDRLWPPASGSDSRGAGRLPRRAEPKFALAAAIGAGFVLLVFVDLAAGLALFSFFSFLEMLELGSVISVGKPGGALLALGWLAFSPPVRSGARLPRHPPLDVGRDRPLSRLVTAQLFLGREPAAALGVNRALRAQRDPLHDRLHRDRNPRHAALVTSAFVAGAVAAAAYGMAERQLHLRRTAGRLRPRPQRARLGAGRRAWRCRAP